MVIMLTRDLFFFPAVRQQAETHGSSARMANDLAATLELMSDDTQAVLVDLSAISLADLPEIATQIRDASPSAVLAAFGPHVHQIRLEKAQEAGFEPVLSRGALDHQLPLLMENWINKAS